MSDPITSRLVRCVLGFAGVVTAIGVLAANSSAAPPLVLISASVASGKLQSTGGIEVMPATDEFSLPNNKEQGYVWLVEKDRAVKVRFALPKTATGSAEVRLTVVGWTAKDVAKDVVILVNGKRIEIAGPKAEETKSIRLTSKELDGKLTTGENEVEVRVESGRLGVQTVSLSHDIVHVLGDPTKNPVKVKLISPAPGQIQPLGIPLRIAYQAINAPKGGGGERHVPRGIRSILSRSRRVV